MSQGQVTEFQSMPDLSLPSADAPSAIIAAPPPPSTPNASAEMEKLREELAKSQDMFQVLNKRLGVKKKTRGVSNFFC